jgi:hypothetical protein
MLLSRHHNARQNHDIKLSNRSFENVAQFKYLETAVISQNLILMENKRRLYSGNACCHLIQNLWSSYLLSKNKKLEYTNLYFACGSVWLRNLVVRITGFLDFVHHPEF